MEESSHREAPAGASGQQSPDGRDGGQGDVHRTWIFKTMAGENLKDQLPEQDS